MSVIIMTDSSCDLPLSYIEENKVPFVSLTCHFNKCDYKDDFGKTFTYRQFYDGLRNGEMPTTSQVNIYQFTEVFTKLVKGNKSIIYIGMSSGISGTVNSASMARESVLEEYKDADITIIDSKSACIGQGILVYNAVEMMKKGCSKEEIIKWIEGNKLNINHWFMVGTLKHLRYGGRISATAATIGTLMKINPIIFINNEGKLVNVTNVRGRKKAIKYLLEKFKERIVESGDQRIMISHGDCLEDALYLEKSVKEEFGVKETMINFVGPVIASHTGPDMLSLCFIGKGREI
ncbi:DegV family protein [Haloimpatiens massiliensis]|uniref:DegV family protein n=1 Tax=Haloimpatiens massiliensis TaxID=1658110 RepID=UPI000C84AEC8|nr:DegV family protein [Haloimpatiens massiliensis]